MPKFGDESWVEDENGNTIGVRETTDDGRKSYFYPAEDGFWGPKKTSFYPTEVARHWDDGTTDAWEYSPGLNLFPVDEVVRKSTNEGSVLSSHDTPNPLFGNRPVSPL